MKFFLSIATIAVYATAFLSLVACSNDKSIAGIEIGNPSIADSDTTARDTAAKDSSVKDTTIKDTTSKDTADKTVIVDTDFINDVMGIVDIILNGQ